MRRGAQNLWPPLYILDQCANMVIWGGILELQWIEMALPLSNFQLWPTILEENLSYIAMWSFPNFMELKAVGNTKDILSGGCQDNFTRLCNIHSTSYLSLHFIVYRILCSQSHAQLRQIFHQYRIMTGQSIIKTIQKEFSGNIQDGKIARDASIYVRVDLQTGR